MTAMIFPNGALPSGQDLENILKTVTDARMISAFPADGRGIMLNNLRFSETVPDPDHAQRTVQDHSIIMNLLIQYVRSGEVNNLSGIHGRAAGQAAGVHSNRR